MIQKWLLICAVIFLFACLCCGRFSQVHDFEKPNDERALNLMNSCAVAVSSEYPDIVFSYGYNDEYRLVP